MSALTDIAALYAGNAWLFAGSIFIMGLVVGSFLNVVIYRVPLMLERSWRAEAEAVLAAGDTPGDRDADVPASPSAAGGLPTVSAESGVSETSALQAGPSVAFNLFTPRSSCTHCQAPIKPWHNIPVLSWLWLRGRCAACQAPISMRYPLVELATAMLSAAVAWRFGFDPVCACALGVTWALIALTGIDIDHQLLPDGITLPLMWAGLLASVVMGASGNALPVSPRDALIGAAAGYLSLWLVYHAFRLATGKEGMGYGDFKLYAALGAWLGWKILPLVILLSAATGAVLGIALILLRGRDRSQPIPFGPYLAAAGWLAMLYGNSLLEGYLRLSGINR